MADNGSIRLEGLQDVLQAMSAKRVEINRAASLGLRKAGLNIIADAQINLRTNRSWASGLLANSGRVIYNSKEYSQNEGAALLAAPGVEGMDVGFFDKSLKSKGYAMSVEFGRPAGQMPPPNDLKTWVIKKWEIKEPKALLRACRGLALHIARRGTSPHPFFTPAVNKNTKGGGLGGVFNHITAEVAKAIRHDTAKMALKARSIMQEKTQ